MALDPLSLLKAARQRIDVPTKWTTRISARGPAGDPLMADFSRGCWTLMSSLPIPTEPVRFCLVGAVKDAVLGEGVLGELKRGEASAAALDALADTLKLWFWKMPSPKVHVFNDHPETRHADVLRLLDTTIARLEEKK